MSAVQHPLDTGGQMQGACLLKGLNCLPHGSGDGDEEASDEVICCLHVFSEASLPAGTLWSPSICTQHCGHCCPMEADLPGPLSPKGQAVLWAASLGFY